MVPCSGIEVDKENIYAIEKLPYQKDIRGIWNILGCDGFYRKISKDFSKI
jgi:hypothetical protein